MFQRAIGSEADSDSTRILEGEVSEWLVTDRIGGFAMGTPNGIRTRKYHGFALTSPSRGETAWLSDLELSWGDRSLWPHRYTGDIVDHPEAAAQCRRCFELSPEGFPSWKWDLPKGRLRFSVLSTVVGVLTLRWEWSADGARSKSPVALKLRPFFSLRSIHALGGKPWRILPAESSGFYRIQELNGAQRSASGASDISEVAECWLRMWSSQRGFAQQVKWRDESHWYRNFEYSEEAERGYPSREDLFSAGYWDLELKDRFELRIAADEKALKRPARAVKERRRGGIWDFSLERPAGVCAGYPWFGEWGRDTFISLPGMVAARQAAGESDKEVYLWAEAVLGRWEKWILSDGMIPNLLGGPEGMPQWESCDATLWWSHALTALWVNYLDRPEWADRLKRRFSKALNLAVRAIQEGRHRFLRLESDGAIAVTAMSDPLAYSSWMDARFEGKAVTPRTGRLPEINALWFQERCLQSLWESGAGPLDLSELQRLAGVCMICRERDRPNEVFLFSIPLAPAFALQCFGAANERVRPQEFIADLSSLTAPCGLRTLAPGSVGFRAQCRGSQAERDRAYHQGTIWPWLGAHLEMARARGLEVPGAEVEIGCGLRPIPGHIPEIYDATPPYQWRGTPAQAWSLACFEELGDRLCRGLDDRLRRQLVATTERPQRERP